MTRSREIATIFRNRLRQARKEQGISQAELGKMLGIKTSAVSHLETGRRLPSFSVLLTLTQVMNKPVGYFVEEAGGGASLSPAVQRLVGIAGTLSGRDVEAVIMMAESLAKRK